MFKNANLLSRKDETVDHGLKIHHSWSFWTKGPLRPPEGQNWPTWDPKNFPNWAGINFFWLDLNFFWLDLNFCGLDFFWGQDLIFWPNSKMTQLTHFWPFFALFIPRKWPECPILVDFSPIFAREWPNWPIFLSQISNYLVTSSIIRSSRSTGNDVSGQ